MAVNDFSNQNIQDTYQRVVQTDGTNLADGTGSADTWNVMTSAGKSYTFTTTGKGLEWANQAISACTANPGGVKSTVSLPQDTVPKASYEQDKTVYFKSFKVA